MSHPLRTDRDADGIVTLWLDPNPAKPRGGVVVLDAGLIGAIADACAAIAREGCTGLVLASASTRVFVAGADLAEIDALVRERDEARRALAAWQANLEEPQEVDPADLQALIDATWKDDRLTVRMSARDLWRMASDHRGRNEE